jgi:cobalt-zinc-cadmium efflux system outer membrane protein
MSLFVSSHRTCLSRGLAVALFALSSHAQEVSPPTFTLSAALERALEQNPGLIAQGYSARAAEGLIEQAGLRPNPTLDVSVENVLGTGRVQGVRSLETTVQAKSDVRARGQARQACRLRNQGARSRREGLRGAPFRSGRN